MMKSRLGWSVFLVLTMTSSWVAAQEYGTAGCGLGSMLIESDGAVQIFAATSNSITSTQTFGITSGTSNCVEEGLVREDKEQEAFVEANLRHLRRDMAAGNGEHLAAFAHLLGCTPNSYPQVARLAQASFSSVFPSPQTTAAEILYLFRAKLQRSPVGASCARI